MIEDWGNGRYFGWIEHKTLTLSRHSQVRLARENLKRLSGCSQTDSDKTRNDRETIS